MAELDLIVPAAQVCISPHSRKYEEALFSHFGGVSRAARSMRPSGKVSAFMNQNPRKVAAFVSECLDYRRFEASDLLPYATRETLEELGLVGYQIDTFSSDYDDYIDESGMVYQLPNGPVKAGRRWGQRHPQGANLGSNGILKYDAHGA